MAIFVAFVFAFIASIIFLPYKNGSVSALIVFFVVLFMAAIASSLWVVPIGPPIWGVSWLPMLFTVILFALLFSAPSPRRPASKKNETEEPSGEATSVLFISIFTWIIFIVLFILILFGLYKSAW